MIKVDEGLRRVGDLARTESWLAVLVTAEPDGPPAVSVVNAGIMTHPVTGARAVAFVSRGDTKKLRNLRARSRATLVFRAGWDWIAVTGPVDLVGPDDPLPGLTAERLPGLLREIYAAAGGRHPDLDAYDREMVADRRVAVLIEPEQFTTNPTPHDRAD